METKISNAAVETANVDSDVKSSKKAGKNQDAPKRPKSKWSLISSAKKRFDSQFYKSNEVKLNCLMSYLVPNVVDIDSWWGDYYKEVKRLIDSRSFVNDCQRKGFNPLNVAEHVVFCGSKVMNNVLYSSVEAVFGDDVLFFRGRLTPKSDRINELRKLCMPLLWDNFEDKATAEDAEAPAQENETDTTAENA